MLRSIRIGRLLATIVCALVVVSASASMAVAATIHVSTGGDDLTGDGSAGNPYRTITKGMTVATSGDMVQAAAGLYTLGETFPVDLKSGVTLQGAGAPTTTLQGDGTSSVVRASNVSSSTKIDGFTITGGIGVPFESGFRYGGGICCDINAAPTISNSVITGNGPAKYGGGIAFRDGSTARLSVVEIYGNSAELGGGVYCTASSPTLDRCDVYDNSALNAGGGVFSASSSSPTITASRIASNTAGFDAAGLWLADGSPKLVNNVIERNTAGRNIGGVAVHMFANATIVNCTVQGNTSPGIHVGSATATIFNSIVWENGDDLSNCTATYSDIEDGDPGTGNISQDPLYVNKAEGNFHLASGSPCIDVATNTAAPSQDKDGVVRPRDGNGDGSAIADMGAYEYAGLPATWHVSVTGSDTAGDGGAGNPFRTIDKGMTVAMTGDSVQVAGGTYAEDVTMKSGVVLQGAGSDETTVQGTGAGPVVVADGASAATIDGFTITGGVANEGGGVRAVSAGNLTITNNRIVGNQATDGGGIYCHHVRLTMDWSPYTIEGNVIADNTAVAGGGIYCEGRDFFVCNNLITGNTAWSGGGIACYGARVYIRNGTLASNGPLDGQGVAVYFEPKGDILVPIGPAANCVIWNDGDDLYGYAAIYSDVEDGDPGTGNISVDPQFVDAASGDYRLKASSPCIDTGTNSGAPAADKDGVSRPQDGDGDGNATCDMGAFERPYMALDSGAVATDSTTVTVDSSFAGAAEMRVRNESGAWSDWRAYASGVEATIPATEGTRTVDAEYRYATDKTMTLSDTIVYDTSSPDGTVTINGGASYATTTTVALALDASDAVSGVDKVRISNDGVFDSEPWENFATTKSWTLESGDGAKTVYAEFKDHAGNISATAQDDIELDTSVPSGTFTINEGATYTTTMTVSLDCTITDCDQMRYRNQGGAWSDWQAYAQTKSWALASPDGTKTVEAEYRDVAGNVLALADSIVLDTTLPQAPTNLAASPGDTTIDLSWTNPAGDFALTRVLRSETDFATSPAPLPDQLQIYQGTEETATDAGLVNGTQYYYTAFCRDAAGNWSAPATVVASPAAPTALTIELDRTSTTYNSLVSIAGSLTAGSVGMPGRTNVTLWRSANGVTWSADGIALYNATSDRYEAARRVTAKVYFQLRFGGEPGCQPCLSPSVPTACRASLWRPWTYPRTVRRGRVFYVFGYLKPRHYGWTRLYIYRYVRGRWRFYTLRYARNYTYWSYTRYRLAYRLRYPGRYCVRAYHNDGDHYPTWSSARVFYVR